MASAGDSKGPALPAPGSPLPAVDDSGVVPPELGLSNHKSNSDATPAAASAAAAATRNNAGADAANDRLGAVAVASGRPRVSDPPADAPRDDADDDDAVGGGGAGAGGDFDGGDGDGDGDAHDRKDEKHVSIAADAQPNDGGAGGRIQPGQPGWADVADAGGDESDAESMADLDPNHPLLAPVQNALKAQLSKHDERVTLGLRQAEEANSKLAKKRELLGVSLYNFQKAYAKLQISLEKTHDEYAEANKTRIEKESLLKGLNEKFAETRAKKSEVEKSRAASQAELDKIKITVQEIDAYNEKLKSEILVTRRGAYGAEDAMQQKEKEKARQDALIDTMNEQMRQYTETSALYTAQLEAQKKETATAKAALASANAEMDAIGSERKEYLQKWKSSLLGMASRDAALKQAEEALEQQRQKLVSMDMEMTGMRTQIKAEEEKRARDHEVVERLTATLGGIDTQLEAVAATRKELSTQYQFFRTALEQTDAQLRTVLFSRRELQSDADSLKLKREKLEQDKRKLEKSMLENFSSRTTIEKGKIGVLKQTMKLQSRIHDAEIKIGEIQNEIARIKVDALNTAAHNKELKLTLTAYDKELKDRDALGEKYEAEIRQRHDKIEKKQIYIMRLNKKFEHITANKQVDENTGPLEATIKNVSKEIMLKVKESAELQKEWIKSQTELVSNVSDTAAVQSAVAELSARETILSQKRTRLRQSTGSHLDEIKNLHLAIRTMQNDMTKLNELIAKNTALHQTLANQNFTIETDFHSKMGEQRGAAMRLDEQLQTAKDDKEKIFNEIGEVEKQIMLWEKKIQLEKETQQALDPTYGQPEIVGMKKEIHRMRLRLAALKKQQELMSQDMIRTVHKHDAIKLSHMQIKAAGVGGGAGASAGKQVTAAVLTKKVQTLKGQLKQNQSELQSVTASHDTVEADHTALSNELAKHQRTWSDREDDRINLQHQIEAEAFQRDMGFQNKLMYQERTRAYDDMLKGKYRAPPKEKTIQALMQRQQEYTKIQTAVKRMLAENPKYNHWLALLANYLGLKPQPQQPTQQPQQPQPATSSGASVAAAPATASPASGPAVVKAAAGFSL